MDRLIGKFQGIPIRLCKCGALPHVYEEGFARRNLTGGEDEMYFVELYNYFIECEECGNETYRRSLKDAIEAWNNMMEELNEN